MTQHQGWRYTTAMQNSNDPVDRNRRHSFLWILYSLTFSAFPFHKKSQAATDPNLRRSLEAALKDIVKSESTAKQIGADYLATHPDEMDFNRLAGELIEANFEGDSQSLRQRISAQRVRDFANEDVIIVDGWVLARVEVRVCALLYLI